MRSQLANLRNTAMPLRTACSSCGKKLQVRDELAGKKVKCPDCGKVFIAAAAGAPSGAEGAAAIKASPSKPSPPPVTRDKVAAKPMAKRPAPPPVDEDDEDDVDERPATRGKPAGSGSKRVLWIALAGVLVLAAGAAGYYFFFMGPPATVGPVVKKGGPPKVPVEEKTETTARE